MKTVLTDERIGDIWHTYNNFEEQARAVEQAVLESPEIQALIEALQWAVDNPDDSAFWIHQAKDALASIRPECLKCEGHGTVIVLSDNSPDAEHVETECPHCDLIHGDNINTEEHATEIQALRKDAERYGWLKENIMEQYNLPGSYYLPDDAPEVWDLTIDAAMEKQT